MVVEAAAEGGKQHGFAIDGQGIADVKPVSLSSVGFFIDHRVNAGHLFAFFRPDHRDTFMAAVVGFAGA